MAFRRKRIPTFGREDRTSGLRTLLRGQSFFVRLVAFLIVAALFLIAVNLTHKGTFPVRTTKDTVISTP